MYDIKQLTKYPYTHVSQNNNSKMQRFGLNRRTFCYIAALLIGTIFLYTHFFSSCDDANKAHMYPKESVHYLYDEENKSYPYDRQMPLVFIGGVPRSGTTLMRAMLDAHPDVRCGEETRVIPRILGMRGQWAKSKKESKRLEEAGLSDEVIDDALSAFILEVIAKHGEPAPRLCNKDPFTLKSSVYLAHLFPNSKFILMIRDGRAVVHSIISRKVTISGFDLKSYPSCLKKWNAAMESMYYQCLKVGSSRCLPVYYEQLVLHPERWMKHILSFLEIEWDDAVLHHEEFINKPGGISLSKTERSTDQVVKPINLAALTAWVDHIPTDIRASINQLAPMLDRLGYDPHKFPPNYGDPDKQILANTADVEQNAQHWAKRGQDIYAQLSPQKHANKYKNHNEHVVGDNVNNHMVGDNLDSGGDNEEDDDHGLNAIGGIDYDLYKEDRMQQMNNKRQHILAEAANKQKRQANRDINSDTRYLIESRDDDEEETLHKLRESAHEQNDIQQSEHAYKYKYVYNKPEDDLIYENKAS